MKITSDILFFICLITTDFVYILKTEILATFKQGNQSATSYIRQIGEHYVNADSRELAALKHYMPSVFDQAGSLKLVENLKAEEILEFFVLYDWDFCSLTSTSFNFFIDNIIVTEKDDGHFSLRTVDQSLNGKPLFV